MKIFLYTPFYLPQSQAAAIRCYWLTQTIKAAGHNISVFSSIETTESRKLHFNPTDNKQGFAKRFIYEFLAGLELLIRIFFSKYDLYILSSPPFITILLGHFGCKLKNSKYVIDVRDLYPDVYFAQGLLKQESFLGKIARFLTRSMYRNAYGILSVTPGLINKIKKISPNARTELLINGYDKDIFKPSIEKYEKFTVVFHGNMGKVQNIPVILQIAKMLKNEDVEFIFIGEGPQSILLNDDVPENVKYLGPKTYNEIPSIISKAHIGFSARRDDEIGIDAFPVKVFEYLGVGIPVILTPKSDAMKDMVERGIYEFNTTDLDGIAKKIIEVKKYGESIKLKQDMSRQEVSKKILRFCNFN